MRDEELYQEMREDMRREDLAEKAHEGSMRNDYEYFLNFSCFNEAVAIRKAFFKQVEEYGWDLEQAIEDFENS